MKKRLKNVWLLLILLLTAGAAGCRNPAVSTGGESTDTGTTSFTSEGSANSPVEITDINSLISGQVDTGTSYYKTNGLAANHNVTVYLDSLSDDVDLIEYGTDSTYSQYITRPFYGRTRKESVMKAGYGTQDLYFSVDGSYTSRGASYTLRVTSQGNAVSIFVNQGSSSDPVEIEAGYQEYGQVGYGATQNDPGTSYYKVTVTPGSSYCVNAYTGVTLAVYSDLFVTPVTLPYTPSAGTLYLKVTGTYTSFVMEAVKKEGSSGGPVVLFIEKTNFCQVDGTSSYYKFAVTEGESYTVTADAVNARRTPAGYDIDLFVYNDGNFTTLAGSSETAGLPESVDLTAGADYITVRVDEKSGSGATFLLTVTED